MRRRALGAAAVALAALALAALAGCDPEKPSGGPADAGPGDAAIASPGAAPAGSAAGAGSSQGGPRAPAEPAAEHLQLLKMTLTSSVKNKEPVDKLEAAQAGERVYAHLALRNRTEETRQVELVFEVGGSTRSRVVLDVEESWQWRTWAYATLRDGDSGELVVTATEIDGPEIAQATLPIRGKGKK